MPGCCLLKHQAGDCDPGDDWIEQAEKGEIQEIGDWGGDCFTVQVKGKGCAGTGSGHGASEVWLSR